MTPIVALQLQQWVFSEKTSPPTTTVFHGKSIYLFLLLLLLLLLEVCGFYVCFLCCGRVWCRQQQQLLGNFRNDVCHDFWSLEVAGSTQSTYQQCESFELWEERKLWKKGRNWSLSIYLSIILWRVFAVSIMLVQSIIVCLEVFVKQIRATN